MKEIQPFGFRILASVDLNVLENMTGKILTGVIVKEPSINETNIGEYIKSFNSSLTIDGQLLLYLNALHVLKKGMTVKFNNEEKLIDIKDGLYNIPIELIRSFEL